MCDSGKRTGYRMAEQSTKNTDLLTRLNTYYPHMSKGQRLLYQYILGHYADVSHMTADALGKAVGVSESTVVRFAMFLGYEGYPQFKQAVERHAQMHLNPVELLQDRFAGRSPEQVLKDVLREDANRIRAASENMDPHAFAGVVDLILSAKRIYIAGQAGMEPPAAYLAYGLQMVFEDVILLNNVSEAGAMLPVLHAGAQDVLLVIGSGERTEDLVRLLLFMHARDVRIATFFTGEEVRRYADLDCTIPAEQTDDYTAGRLVVCYSILHALLTALYLQRPEVIRDGTDALLKLQPQEVV